MPGLNNFLMNRASFLITPKAKPGRRCDVMNFNLEFANGLMPLAYLISYTLSVTLLSGWALEQFLVTRAWKPMPATASGRIAAGIQRAR